MDELQVLVRQTPGVITWNFEDLKIALKEEMENYKSLVYTDESIPVAKKDVAQLRKLKTMVEDRRKEIKNRCLEPYEIIEAQAKELGSLIDEPIKLIDQQVKAYEKEQKKQRKATIDAYMTEKFHDLPEEIALKAKMKVYDVRWLNATYKVKDWQTAVDECAEEINRCLDLLNNTEAEFKEEAFNVYGQNLDFSAAVARVQELQAQKERILAAERRRKEEAERRAREEAERHAAEERRRKEEAERHAREAEAAKQDDSDGSAAIENHADDPAVFVPEPDEVTIGDVIESVQREAFSWSVQDEHEDGSIHLRIYGTEKEQIKIQEYIRFLGVPYEVL